MVVDVVKIKNLDKISRAGTDFSGNSKLIIGFIIATND